MQKDPDLTIKTLWQLQPVNRSLNCYNPSIRAKKGNNHFNPYYKYIYFYCSIQDFFTKTPFSKEKHYFLFISRMEKKMNFNDFVFILLPATGMIPKEKVLYSCFALFWITFSVFSNKRHYRRWIELFCLAFHLHFKMVFSRKLYQSNKTLVFFSSIHSEVKWKSYFWFYKQGRKRWARMIKGHKAQIWMEAFRIYVDDDWSITTTYPCLTGLRYRLELLLIVKAKIDNLLQWFFGSKEKLLKYELQKNFMQQI